VRPEPVSTQDATLWSVQPDDLPLQFGGVAIFEAAPLRDDAGRLRVDAIRERIEAQLPRVPRFRQRLRQLPLGQGLVWVDHQGFDLTQHLRVHRLEAPGDETALRRFVAKLLEVPLDPSRPLWEIWIVDGLDGDRLAVVPKVSHVMADGMAVLEFAFSLLDSVPPSSEPTADRSSVWSPAPEPAGWMLAAATVVERARRQLTSFWDVASGVAAPRRLIGAASSVLRFGATGDGRAPALRITQPVGRHRDVAWTRLPWTDLQRIKAIESVTLNDIVLTITAGALADYLGPSPSSEGRPPRVLVPVSTHGGSPGSEIENRFSMMVASLPTGPGDPVERLRTIHAEMQRHKEADQASIGPVLFGLGALVPLWVLRSLGPVLLRNQPLVNLAVTNLPGSRDPLSLLGARLLDVFPYVGVTGNIAVIVGVISYGDKLEVGVTVDADLIPDLDALIRAFERATEELVEACDLPARQPG
jgi:WS/DGAT/MGAT family acyltransferase